MFEVKNVYKKKNQFDMFVHNLSLNELNNAIIDMLFSYNALNYVFNGSENIKGDYIKMLQRFIPQNFINREKEALSDWNNTKIEILKMMNKNKSFYSFYAEALMAYFNYKYLDNTLLSAVLNINDTLTDQRTGGDSCMISKNYLVLGEAKFYKDFNSAKYQIKQDFSSNSLNNKLDNLYRNYNNCDIIVKDIFNNKNYKLVYEEFLKLKIILSGFILHDKQVNYKYEDIDDINILVNLTNYSIIFYHLPIESKETLILLIIKKALELITNGSKR